MSHFRVLLKPDYVSIATRKSPPIEGSAKDSTD